MLISLGRKNRKTHWLSGSWTIYTPNVKLKPSYSSGFWVTLELKEEIGRTQQPSQQPLEWSLTTISKYPTPIWNLSWVHQVEKQSTKLTFPNEAHPGGMVITIQKQKRVYRSNMADSCYFTKSGGMVQMQMKYNNHTETYPDVQKVSPCLNEILSDKKLNKTLSTKKQKSHTFKRNQDYKINDKDTFRIQKHLKGWHVIKPNN